MIGLDTGGLVFLVSGTAIQHTEKQRPNALLNAPVPSITEVKSNNGPCHVSGIFLPLRVKSLPLATIYEVKIPLRKWKKSLLQRNLAQMTWAIGHSQYIRVIPIKRTGWRFC
jgi:hypothetical protein